MTNLLVRSLVVFLLVAVWQVNAFGTPLLPTTRGSPSLLWSSSSSSEADTATPVTIEKILKDNYPEFCSLLSKNENIFAQLQEAYADTGYTIFAPNSEAFEALGDKKRKQLEDPRNLETAQKMGLYHVVAAEALGITQLNREDWTVPKTPEGLPALKYGALVTLGGEVPIGRFKKKSSGNFLDNLLGGENKNVVLDDQGKPVTELVVGPEGKILRSLKLGNAIIHEVDGLVSPMVMWRYCDQLRIPGF